MQPKATKLRRTSLGIGLGCGLLASAIGVTHWTLTTNETATSVADF